MTITVSIMVIKIEISKLNHKMRRNVLMISRDRGGFRFDNFLKVVKSSPNYLLQTAWCKLQTQMCIALFPVAARHASRIASV